MRATDLTANAPDYYRALRAELVRLRQQNRLHQRGFRSDKYPVLSDIAARLHPEQTRIELAIKLTLVDAVAELHDTDEDHKQAIRCDFALIDGLGTRPYQSRRTEARLLLGIGEATYEKLQAVLADDLAGAICDLQTMKNQQAEHELQVTTSAVQSDVIGRALTGTHDDPGSSPPQLRGAHRRVGFLMVALLATLICALVLALVRSGGNNALPPNGSIINADTGKVFTGKADRRGLPLDANASLAGGPIFYDCDLTALPACPNTKAQQPLHVRLGDVIYFSISLSNTTRIPLPYFRVTVNIGVAGRNSIGLTAQIYYPDLVPPNCRGYCSNITFDAANPLTLVVDNNPANNATLVVIPGSTQLRTQGTPSRLVGFLPNGIATSGIQLVHLGIPYSECFECQSSFERLIEFRARIAT